MNTYSATQKLKQFLIDKNNEASFDNEVITILTELELSCTIINHFIKELSLQNIQAVHETDDVDPYDYPWIYKFGWGLLGQNELIANVAREMDE